MCNFAHTPDEIGMPCPEGAGKKWKVRPGTRRCRWGGAGVGVAVPVGHCLELLRGKEVHGGV